MLAAGVGRRLGALTEQLPKALLPVVGDVTIFDVIVGNLAAAGITEIAVVVGHAAEAFAARRPATEARYGVRLELVVNERARDWNNAYSLWLARDAFAHGALVVNGDTLHPYCVERTLLDHPAGADIVLALDGGRPLGEEAMKVHVDPAGRVVGLTKRMRAGGAVGEYIGVCRVSPGSAGLADALEATWRQDPHRYYEDGFTEYARRGGRVVAAAIGDVAWVEVDDPADLDRAREIAGRCYPASVA